jgi:hypothetical protein
LGREEEKLVKRRQILQTLSLVLEDQIIKTKAHLESERMDILKHLNQVIENAQGSVAEELADEMGTSNFQKSRKRHLLEVLKRYEQEDVSVDVINTLRDFAREIDQLGKGEVHDIGKLGEIIYRSPAAAKWTRDRLGPTPPSPSNRVLKRRSPGLLK